MEWFETLNLQFIQSESYFNQPKHTELVFYDPWEDYGNHSQITEEVQLKYNQAEEQTSHPQYKHYEKFTFEIPVLTEKTHETYETQNKFETSTQSVIHTDSVIHVLQQDHISIEQISRPIPKIFQKIPKKVVPKQEPIYSPEVPKYTIETISAPKHVQEIIPSRPEVPKHVQKIIPFPSKAPRHVNKKIPEVHKVQKSIPSNNILIEEKLSNSNIEVRAPIAEKVGILLIEQHVGFFVLILTRNLMLFVIAIIINL